MLLFRGERAFDKLAPLEFRTVLDIGSGRGEHSRRFRAQGRQVTSLDLAPPADVIGDYLETEFEAPFDCIWACHVLEHQRNPGAFLDKVFRDLVDGGILALTVPPEKQEIVGGHVSIWNEGLLIYHLILAGFDCSEAALSRYDYNVSIVLRKRRAELPPLRMDGGDIDLLAKYFPIPFGERMSGRIASVNW